MTVVAITLIVVGVALAWAGGIWLLMQATNERGRND